MPVALASTVIGQGWPALVLHGLFGSGTNWRTIARRLGTRLECHLVDQRNHGRSPHARGMAYSDLAAEGAYLSIVSVIQAHWPGWVASKPLGYKCSIGLWYDELQVRIRLHQRMEGLAIEMVGVVVA